ncbi:hypothetical protein EFK50_06885 [Nocardioides marmoriginsengisoli]|uniref:N-acetyltransferase domain-containing protein n=1 Tax=Nocardioides marmoriginsengisoli TaxID=661483 RepID=A0A3N0CLN3_9ACTN|nr:hypothetical protein [Nocardioides marmoriginsengisoli]RNL64249.1 hypothetical protein EFK50_06885 [Nocardioides marmoriginsengisoli]
MSWLDALGWIGSALLIYSVMQARVLRFRVLNLAACVVLTGFNAALEIWPMVAMNIALCAINLWHIRALVSTRHDVEAYAVLEVGAGDAYLRHLLAVHRADLLRFQPDLDTLGDPDLAFVVQRGDETVGVVLLRVEGGTAHVLLDYVTPRYRDFSPGQFIWRHSNVLAGRGLAKVVTSPTMVGAYYARLGFEARGDGSFELALT